MLKPSLKPATGSLKRVPKGPRTKQPSRANQPPLNPDQDMMQCIAFATADQYHLPTLCHALIGHGFQEIDLPRDASNVLLISTDMAAKPDDDAVMFFFRSKYNCLLLFFHLFYINDQIAQYRVVFFN